jgi:hypothetical protein
MTLKKLRGIHKDGLEVIRLWKQTTIRTVDPRQAAVLQSGIRGTPDGRDIRV